MTRTGLSIAALCLFLAAPGETVLAQQPTRTAAARRCCRVPAGTEVMVELAEPVSSKTHKIGQTFAIRLAEPVVVQGQVVLKAGTVGVGEVETASRSGFGGKGAKLVLSARSLTGPGGTVLPLKGLQLAASGQGHSGTATALGAGGILFLPLGVAGIAIHGGEVTFAAGTQATAKLATATTLPSLGKAAKGAGKIAQAPEVAGPINIPAPAQGMGQVVFFRKKSLLGTGQWFNVRENDQALGKLTNGAWFAQAEPPGSHTFTAKTEPEFGDKLTLRVDAGETYFVEGDLAHGVVIGVPNLKPSDRATFNAAAKDLKPAEQASGEDQLKEEPQEKAAR